MKGARYLCAVVLGLILAVLAAGPSPTASAQTGGPTPIKKILMLLAGSNSIFTTSTTFADIPGMTATVTMGKPGCVAVTLSGEFSRKTGDEGVLLRALLDGALMEGHNSLGSVEGALALDDAVGFQLVSYTFWKCSVTSGAHSVQLQWQAITGTGAFVRARTATILGR